MEAEKQRINTIVKTDLEITMEFKKQYKLKKQTLPEALEHAMTLYNEEAKRGEG